MGEPLDIDIWRQFAQHGKTAAELAKSKHLSVPVVLKMIIDVESEMGTNRLKGRDVLPKNNHELESLLKRLLQNA